MGESKGDRLSVAPNSRRANRRGARRALHHSDASRTPHGTAESSAIPRHDAPHEPVFSGFLGAHPVVSFGVALHFLERLASGLGEDSAQALAHACDLTGFDLYVGRRPPYPTERLMQEEPSVGERVAVLSARGGINQRSGARAPSGRQDANL